MGEVGGMRLRTRPEWNEKAEPKAVLSLRCTKRSTIWKGQEMRSGL